LAFEHAQAVVTAAGSDPRIAEQARQQAEKVIGCLFAATGWRVEVRWGAADRPG
jgi:hypothetical protein